LLLGAAAKRPWVHAILVSIQGLSF
jgi:hypothetical protein